MPLIYPVGFFNPIVSGGTTDPFAANVVLFLKCDGSDNSTSISDSSPNNLVVTVLGTARLSNAITFGTGTASLLLEGGQNNVVYIDSPLLAFGTGDFTVECRLYPDSTLITNWSSFGRIMQCGDFSTAGAWQLVRNTTTNPPQPWLDFNNGTPRINPDVSMSLNTWHHLAFTRQSNTVRLFLNGNLIGSASDSTNLNQTRLIIGGNSLFSINAAARYDDIRITNAARYTANFNPETDTYLNA